MSMQIQSRHDFESAPTRVEMALLAARLRAEMVQLAAELRANLARVQLAQELTDLRSEIRGLVPKMYVALLVQTLVLLGFFYFFLTELR